MLTKKNTGNIVLVADPSKIQVKHQIQCMEDLGVKVIVLSPQLGPLYDTWLWQGDTIKSGNTHLGLDHIDGVIVGERPPCVPTYNRFDEAPYKLLNWSSWFHEYSVQYDRYSTMMGWLFHLERLGKPMFNPQSKSLLSSKKPFQLTVLKESGCLLPDTLITNDPSLAKNFISKYPDAIMKPAAGGTETVTAGEMTPAQWDMFKTSPVILQERIYGADLRVMLVEHSVVSVAAINVPKGTLDFRANKDYKEGNITYDEITLPKDIELICSRVTRALGLRFAGIDIKLTNDEQYCFLECNSGPIYLDVEYKLKHPITENLIQALIEAKNT